MSRRDNLRSDFLQMFSMVLSTGGSKHGSEDQIRSVVKGDNSAGLRMSVELPAKALDAPPRTRRTGFSLTGLKIEDFGSSLNYHDCFIFHFTDALSPFYQYLFLSPSMNRSSLKNSSRLDDHLQSTGKA